MPILTTCLNFYPSPRVPARAYRGYEIDECLRESAAPPEWPLNRQNRAQRPCANRALFCLSSPRNMAAMRLIYYLSLSARTTAARWARYRWRGEVEQLFSVPCSM